MRLNDNHDVIGVTIAKPSCLGSIPLNLLVGRNLDIS